MVFNSLTFFCFFALVVALHALPVSWTARKRNLLIASYLFYASWNPPYVLLLLASSLMYVIEHSAQPEVFSSIPSSMCSKPSPVRTG